MVPNLNVSQLLLNHKYRWYSNCMPILETLRESLLPDPGLKARVAGIPSHGHYAGDLYLILCEAHVDQSWLLASYSRQSVAPHTFDSFLQSLLISYTASQWMTWQVVVSYQICLIHESSIALYTQSSLGLLLCRIWYIIYLLYIIVVSLVIVNLEILNFMLPIFNMFVIS